jgi:antitoxin CptB
MDKMDALKKRAIFLAAKRAMLENELFLREFVTNHLPEHYGEKEMVELTDLLQRIFDNDLFDIVMGNKKTEDFEGQYNLDILKDIEHFAWHHREIIKKEKGV